MLTSLPSAGDIYRVEPVYLLASEVGGDFSQILERPDGARVVLVGDVSGKGLKPAMLISATAGMSRVISSSSPAEILAAADTFDTIKSSPRAGSFRVLRQSQQLAYDRLPQVSP